MNTKGFTLMEVTLFLAISSILSLVAFIGLGPRLRNVRFTDSVRGIESSVTRAISSSQSGENNSARACENKGGKAQLTDPKNMPIIPGTSADCVNGGVWIYFKGDSIQYYQIPLLRKRIQTGDCTTRAIESAVDVAVCFGFQPFDPNTTSPEASYSLTNGLKRTGDSDVFIGYVVNPENNQKYLFVEGQENSPSKKICYALNGRKASVNFSTESIEPKVVFNDESCT